MGSEFVWKEKEKEPGKFGLYHVADKGDFRFIRNAVEGEIEKTDLGVLFTNKEKRVICGKPRTCKLSAGKIIDVYDDDKKVFVPYDEFLRQQEEYKTNPIFDDTKDEKKEYFTTHGKKTRETKEDKKPDKQTVPLNTTTTSNINLPISGTSGASITIQDPSNTQIDKKTEGEKEIREVEVDEDPYSWYIKKVLRRV